MHFLVPSLTFLAIGGFTLPISGGFTLRKFGGAKLLITRVKAWPEPVSPSETDAKLQHFSVPSKKQANYFCRFSEVVSDFAR